MNKQELKTICDASANKITSNPVMQEQIMKSMMKYSTDGKTISTAGMVQYCLEESQEFTKKLLYSVLCEALEL
jgi:hypothetical protein